MANRNGHIAWGPWVFDYNVTDFEGLALLNGSYRGISIFYKISLPVIRVKYVKDGGVFSSGCGPYNDIIRWDPYTIGDLLEDATYFARNHHLSKISNCGDSYVCVREIWDRAALEIGVYARIGEYHLYQCYYIHRDGYIYPRLWSKGLSCNLDHRHHPYWRFDIDVDGTRNRINYRNPEGSGFYTTEGGGTIANVEHHWLIENTQSGNGVWIIPGSTDTARSDDFSRYDFYIRKYRSNEDKEWWRKPEQEIGFATHEGINENTDVVFWYIAHLHHHASEGEHHWHEVGPTLQVNLRERDIPANQIRRISLRGSMNVVDDEWGRDETSSRTFNEFRDLSPDNRYAEFYIEERMGGEIRVEFRITLEWNNGYVNVNHNTKLFEGTSEDTNDLDGEYSSGYNLNNDTWEWRSFTVSNTDEDDPDRASIEFRLDNVQRP